MTSEQFFDRLWANLKTLHTRIVTWISIVWTGIGLWWATMASEDRLQFITDMPILKYLAPVLALVTILGARVWPQTPSGIVKVTYADGTVATGPAGASAMPRGTPVSTEIVKDPQA